MLIGYARVSTRGQSVDTQIALLRRHGAEKIWKETVSTASQHRPELVKALVAIEPGQTLLVTRLDRLARSSMDFYEIVAYLEEKNARFKSLAEPWADTTTSVGRLITAILSGVAEFERELIDTRMREGRDRAKQRGVQMGRPHRLTRYQQQQVAERLESGETTREVARTYNVSHNTIARIRRREAGAQ